MDNAPLTIRVWSDLACPWCWIGKRTLDQAIAAFDHPVTLSWHAFELNPNAPATAPQSVDYAQRLANKYGTSYQKAQGFIDRMVAAGQDRGVAIDFDRIRPSNTFNAHRLVVWSGEHGLQTELKERLFSAYLSEGRSLSDPETLTACAEAAGLDRSDAVQIIASSEYADQVRHDQQLAVTMGITGVPCFVFGSENIAVSGAQPPEVLLQTMRQARP